MVEYTTNDVSIIICTKNMAGSIRQVLESAVANRPGEIIIMDGGSTDKTVEYCKEYTDNIYTDPGRGLSTARNLGIDKSTKKLIFFLGPDNLIEKDTLEKLIRYREENNWAVTGMLTRINKPRGYVERGNDYRYRVRLTPGEKTKHVVGTPYLVSREIFEHYRYDPDVEYSDDNSLMDQLKRDGYKIGRVDKICYDTGTCGKNDTVSRFKMYGLADAQYYSKNKNNWTTLRKVRSLLHPIIAEFIEPLSRTRNIRDLIYIPFLLWITTIRLRVFWAHLIR